ncbi:glutathione S-transferase A-like isoform X1 [Branchiostoma floridae x Branchiostoma japonicum]
MLGTHEVMSTDITLYWGSGSIPCWRAMICLEEKGLSGYDSKLISLEKKEQKSDEILKINPRGQVPAFKHGDVVVNESMAICLYLEECIVEKIKALAEELSLWEKYLSQSGDGFLITEDFTLADAALIPALAFLKRMKLPMKEGFPHLASYYERVKDRPSVQSGWPPHWKETPGYDYLKDV